MTPEEQAQWVARFELPRRPCCTTTLRPNPDGQWMLFSEHVEKIEQLKAQLAQAHEQLEAQRMQTYQAVERERRCKNEGRRDDPEM